MPPVDVADVASVAVRDIPDSKVRGLATRHKGKVTLANKRFKVPSWFGSRIHEKSEVDHFS
jgi:hypothetical protein